MRYRYKIPDKLFNTLIKYEVRPYSTYGNLRSIKDIGLCVVEWKVEIVGIAGDMIYID